MPRYLVCWFLAPVEDAEAIRSTLASGDRKREEWTHLVVPGVDGQDMNVLEKLLRPKRPKGSSRIGGQILDRSKLTAEPFTCVSQVSPEFVHALSSLSPSSLPPLALSFSTSIDGVSESSALALLQSLCDFSRQALDSGQPVLELDMMS